MVGKPNLPVEAEGHNGVRGSSLESYTSPLDQERASSMADEGGAAGALTDMREQHAAARRERDLPPHNHWLVREEQTAQPRWLLWAAIAGGCAVLGGSLVLAYRRL
jgi:hypothetical protein